MTSSSDADDRLEPDATPDDGRTIRPEAAEGNVEGVSERMAESTSERTDDVEHPGDSRSV